MTIGLFAIFGQSKKQTNSSALYNVMHIFRHIALKSQQNDPLFS